MMPNGWKKVTLKEIVKFQQGVQVPVEEQMPEQLENTVRFLRISDYTKTNEPPRYIELQDRLNLVSDDDVVMVRYGEAGRVVRGYRGAIANNLFSISPVSKNDICKQFLFYMLSSAKIQESIASFNSSSTMPQVSHKALYALETSLPPKNEQEKIAKILSTWDEAIEKIEALIISKSKKKSHYILTTMNPSQRGWKSYRVSELGELTKGKGISKSEVVGSGLSCIRYGEIYTSHDIVIRNFRSYISQDTAQNSKRLNKGDIVFAGSGETAEEIGKSVAYLGDDEAYVGGDTIVLSPSGHSSLFLSYLFNSPYTRKQLNVLGQGNAVVHLYPRDLADVTASAPELEQQLKIASYLNALDEEMLVYKRIALCLKNQKQGLMQQLLTGKRRVKV